MISRLWARFLPIPAVLVLGLTAGGLTTLTLSSEAEARCTAIGSSTFCGTRGSHNTVGRSVIFNNGPAGRRIGGAGGFVAPGAGERPTTVIGGSSRGLAAPKTFRGVATRRSFGGTETTDSRIARLRAEILALEAQAQLQELGLTPAQEAARETMSPALARALALTKAARAKAAEEAAGKQGAAPN